MTQITFLDQAREANLDDTFDFLNTDELDGYGRHVDHLEAPADAIAFFAEHRLLDPGEVRRADALPAPRAATMLGRVRRARGAIREIVEAVVAGRPADDHAIATVNAVLRARSSSELFSADGALAVRRRRDGDPVDGALVALVGPLVAAIVAGEAGRLRICANEGCRWVFADNSRTGRKRWCSMASCGNRAKASRHRARKRAASASPAPSA